MRSNIVLNQAVCAPENRRPDATANVSPAAPTINPRRLIWSLRIAMVTAEAGPATEFGAGELEFLADHRKNSVPGAGFRCFDAE
jgi:hypothetical protein